MTERDLFGEPITTLLPPESHDGELLSAWDAFRFAWKRREARDELPVEEHRALARELDRASVAVLRSPCRSLEGVRVKLLMTLCSGPDSELFIRHYVQGHRLPALMPMADFATSQVFDAICAVEHLMAAGEPAREVH